MYVGNSFNFLWLGPSIFKLISNKFLPHLHASGSKNLISPHTPKVDPNGGRSRGHFFLCNRGGVNFLRSSEKTRCSPGFSPAIAGSADPAVSGLLVAPDSTHPSIRPHVLI